jgi:N-terminal domain of anti-restriction factor ArdC
MKGIGAMAGKKAYGKKVYSEAQKAQFREAAEAKREKLDVEFDRSLTQLMAEVAGGHTGRYQDMLKFIGHQHKYTGRNPHLLWMQCLERGLQPRMFLGYEQWQELGRKTDGIPFQVKNLKYETWRAFEIVIPTFKKVENEDGEKDYIKYFSIGHVYDVSQLTEESQLRVPQLFRHLDGDYSALCEQLDTALHTWNIKVGTKSADELLRMTGKSLVQGVSGLGEVNYLDSLPSHNRFLNGVHEFAHELLHTEQDRLGGIEQAQREHEAEMTAYIVASHFNVEAPFTSDYLLNWGIKKVDMKSYLSRISDAARVIINLMEEQEASEEEDALYCYCNERSYTWNFCLGGVMLEVYGCCSESGGNFLHSIALC